MGLLTKRAFDVRLFDVNLSPVMRAADTVASVISVTSDAALTITNISHGTTGVQFLVAGGAEGAVYEILVRFTTTSNPAQRIEARARLVVSSG